MLLRRHATDELIDLRGAPILGEGGQARIHAVTDALVAKIYHRPRESHARKLHAMLTCPPIDPMLAAGHVSIAWPVDLLRPARGATEVVGFLMPRVSGMRPIFEFYNPRSRRRHCPFFDHAYLHRAARNLAAAVTAVHSRGYVIGDLNESNVLLRDTALVTLVDTDSFQVRDARSGAVYRCPVGKAEYTPPELQGKCFADVERGAGHDGFALAALIFQLLMEGAHPFMGEFSGTGEAPPLEKRIGGGHFPFAPLETAFRPPAHALPFCTLAPGVQRLFARCFADGHRDAAARPSALEWQSVLKEAESALVTCPESEQHRFGGHLAECPWCERAARLGGRDPFPSRLAALASATPAALPGALPPQAPLPAAGGVAPSSVPAGRSATGARALALVSGNNRRAIASARAGVARPASFGHLTVANSTHASWIGAALALALLTVASASTFWIVVGGMLAATCAVVGWRRVQALTPGLRPSVGFVLALIAVLLGVKTLATVSSATMRVSTTPRPAPARLLDLGRADDELLSARPSIGPPLRGASAGADQTCGLGARGALHCWGRNRFARLATSGLLNDDVLSRPTRVPTLASVTIREVSVSGAGHGCAVSADDRVYCWGRNDFGQVGVSPADGRGLRSSSAASDPVAADVWGSSVTTGGAHTCVLSLGGAQCFGWNEYGQLGIGTLDDGSASAQTVIGAPAFTALSAGGRHTCGITADGSAYCWGFNGSGQLGVSHSDTRSIDCGSTPDGARAYCEPQPVHVAESHRFRAISAGADHTCGITTEDRLYCWGMADQGQLGTGYRLRTCETNAAGSTRCFSTPDEVTGELRFSTVSAGYAHSCAVDHDGTAFCWGSNSHGQLGTSEAGDVCRTTGGAADCSFVPIQVPGPRFASITAGRRHTCGVTARGETLCWGGNEYGQLGIGAAGGSVQLSELLTRSPRYQAELGGDVELAEPHSPPYFEFQVERQALRRVDSPLSHDRRPAMDPGADGEVLAQFVVDTLGRVELHTVKMLASTGDTFSSAVRASLPDMRFYPAELGGRKVRQLVQMPFRFPIGR